MDLVRGIKSWGEEFAEKHEMEINFTTDVPGAVPSKSDCSCFESYRKPA